METPVNQTNTAFSEAFSRISFDMIYELIPDNNTTHSHLNDVFISSYQLAIAFAIRYPDVFRGLDLQIGGLGIGEYRSLAQRIGKVLSIEAARPRPKVVGGVLSGLHVSMITFRSQDGSEVVSSVSDLTIWRKNTSE